jgi:hypothetical protein
MMLRTNVGRLDRTVRLMMGTVLALIGLFVLGGWQGKPTGIDLTLFALWPLMTGLFGFCGMYLFFGISTVEKSKDIAHHSHNLDPVPVGQEVSHIAPELADGRPGGSSSRRK